MRSAFTGGDTFLQICLWEAGHAITSPGAGFYDWQLRSFDAGSEDRMGLVDYIMRAIEGTCHDRGFCNVNLPAPQQGCPTTPNACAIDKH